MGKLAQEGGRNQILTPSLDPFSPNPSHLDLCQQLFWHRSVTVLVRLPLAAGEGEGSQPQIHTLDTGVNILDL